MGAGCVVCGFIVTLGILIGFSWAYPSPERAWADSRMVCMCCGCSGSLLDGEFDACLGVVWALAHVVIYGQARGVFAFVYGRGGCVCLVFGMM